MQGIILIDKPKDWTSFDVVNYVRKTVAEVENKKSKNVKVGHSGTLDPFATGLLIILIGKSYTKKASEYSGLDKTYEVTMKLGMTSTTGDTEGVVTAKSTVVPEMSDLKTASNKFIGEIYQTPPIYSAIKVDGQRAYKLARSGQPVVLKPRKVKIEKLEITEYSYPFINFITTVSSGTYIRSLVEDIGESLGCGAMTIELRRLSIGKFNVIRSISPKSITAKTISEHILSL